MATVLGTAWWTTLAAAGAAMVLAAPLDPATGGGPDLTGHLLLGLGLGQLAAMVVRSAARRLVQRPERMAQDPAVPQPVVQGLPAADISAVTMLPARPPAFVPLRGRHAA